MDVPLFIFVTIAGILAAAIIVYLCILFVTKVVPKIGLFAGSLALTAISVLFDIRYLCVVAIAFSVAGHFAPSDWFIHACVVSVYCFFVSVFMTINFVTDGFGLNLFELTKEKADAHKLGSEEQEFLDAFLYQLKYYTGLYGFLGSFISLGLLISLHFSVSDGPLSFSDHFFENAAMAMVDQIIDVSPFGLAYDSAYEDDLLTLPKWLQWLLGVFLFNIIALLVGLVIHLFNPRRESARAIFGR